MLHQIGILTCDSHHNFAAIQGIDCVTNCLFFVLFGKEYARISFPFQIVFADQILTASRSIHIMLLLHQLMRSRSLSSSSLQVLHSSAWSWSSWFLQQVFHPEAVQSAHSSEYKDMLKIYYFKILCLVLSWGSIFPMWFCLFPHFYGHNNCKGWWYPCF